MIIATNKCLGGEYADMNDDAHFSFAVKIQILNMA